MSKRQKLIRPKPNPKKSGSVKKAQIYPPTEKKCNKTENYQNKFIILFE